MIVKSVAVGPLEANCFIVGDEISRKSMVIDPGDEPDRIMEMIRREGLSVDYIICTHAHFDHIGAVADVKKETGAKIVLHEDELELYHAARDQAAFWGYEMDNLPEPDIFVKDGDEISAGTIKFKIIHTPGHSPGGICLYDGGIVITGDTLFAGAVGRTDFYGGDMGKLRQSFERLMSLPPETAILPGHGPNSTIERELKENIFS